MKLVLVQALRAFAALLVALHHGQHEAAAIGARTGLAFSPSALLPWPAGVDVFFVISGFIMVHASGPLFGRPGARRLFLARRIARIVPLYWLVSAFFLALVLAAPGSFAGGQGEGGPSAAYVAGSFLFLPMLRPDGTAQPLYGLGWTLHFEMAFYLVFALALGLSRRAAVGAVCAALAGLVLVHAIVPGLPMPLAFWSEPVILEFALGAGLGLARAEGLSLPGPLRAVSALAGLAALAATAHLVGEPGGFVRPLSQGLPAALLVAAAALGRPRHDAPEKAASPSVRALSALGDASYALYLVHPFVLRAAREALLRTHLADLVGPQASLWLMLAATVPAALLVHRLVERPLTARARALLEPDRPENDVRATAGAVPRAADRN